MKEMKLLATLVCALAVLAFAATAAAQSEDSAVDWDEAIEFAEVTDTFVENGVKWETYYDELQGVMWSQPEDATPEAVKAYLSGDQETLKGLDLDICVYQWLVPYWVQIDDVTVTSGDNLVYDRAGALGAAYHKIWRAYGGYANYLDQEFVKSWARNTLDYTDDDYNARFWDRDESGGSWDNGCDGEWSGYSSGYYRYEAYETADVQAWDYYAGYCYKFTKHEFYACEYWRTLEIEFCTQYIE